MRKLIFQDLTPKLVSYGGSQGELVWSGAAIRAEYCSCWFPRRKNCNFFERLPFVPFSVDQINAKVSKCLYMGVITITIADHAV